MLYPYVALKRPLLSVMMTGSRGGGGRFYEGLGRGKNMGSVCELRQRYYLFSQARGEMSHYQKVHCTFYDTCKRVWTFI